MKMSVLIFFTALSMIVYKTMAFPDIVTDPDLDAAWLIYKNSYGKRYTHYMEITRRIIWEENLKTIRDHNLLFDLGLKSYSLGINKFSDLTFDEFKNQFLGLSHSFQNISGETFLPPLNFGKLPDEVDWRKKGYVTPVKDQGMCGSCWAFSAVGAMEGQHFRRTGKLLGLSEQQLVDCSQDFDNEGCNGGYPDMAFMYAKKYGMESENVYPYIAKDASCKYQSSKIVANYSATVRIPKNENELKKAVATVGPVSVCISVLNSFRHYKSGVYDEPACSSHILTHAVLAVGYGTEEKRDYWLIKNSWGESWGMNGYIMMRRNKKNQCGIASEASYPIP